MRIAQIVATFPPWHGGMGYVCQHDAFELARHGHEVTVFTLDHGLPPGTRDSGEFKVVRLRTPLQMGDAGAVPELVRALRHFDVAHLHYPFFGGGEYVWLASRIFGVPYLATYHMDVVGNTPLKKLIINAYEPTIGRQILRGAACVGAVSLAHFQSSRVADLLQTNRVVEIPNGVDTDLFRPAEPSRELLLRYGLWGKTVVLFVGNLQPFKRLDLLIEAVAGLQDRSIALLVVGGGYGEPEYRAQVKRLGIEEQVVFAGPRKPEEDLPEHYALADFLVLPSTHSESFGLVVLEAMATGRPAIVTSLPGPAALVNDGVDGLIARVGDVEDLRAKIERLAHDPSLRKEMGARARAKVCEKYGWRSVGNHLEQIVREIGEGRSRRF